MEKRQCKECGKWFQPKSSKNWYCNDTHYRPCPVCGKLVEVKRGTFNDPPRTCSKECWAKLKDRTCLEKYGCVDPANSEEAKQKRRKTCLTRYGVENPAVLQESKDAAKETFMKKYGVDSPMKLDATKNKIRSNWASKSREELDKIADKRKSTCLEKYGHEYATQSEAVQKKTKATNLSRYGHECTLWYPEIRERINEGFIEKFGTVGFNSCPEIIQKRIDTCRAKYGVDSPLQSPKVQAKIAKTNVERYGNVSPMRVKEIQERIKQTTLERYGVYPVFLREDILQQVRDDMIGKRVSKTQRQFEDILKEVGLDVTEEFIVETKFFDIKVENSNILIEIDPSYTHSQQDNAYHQILDPNYHLDKTRLANKYGYRCIHVFDWDNRLKLGMLLSLNKQRIYARDCVIAMLSATKANTFLNENHIQGGVSRQIVSIGLFLGDELVSVMTFGQPRYTSKYEWELLRYTNRLDCNVIGGANKMFSFFLKEYAPSSIISYCDRSKFEGVVYKKLGMSLDHYTPPAKVWSRNDKKITDNLLRSRGFDQLFKTSFGKGTSNEDLMIEHGWRSVYDCGQAVFIWKSK